MTITLTAPVGRAMRDVSQIVSKAMFADKIAAQSPSVGPPMAPSVDDQEIVSMKKRGRSSNSATPVSLSKEISGTKLCCVVLENSLKTSLQTARSLFHCSSRRLLSRDIGEILRVAYRWCLIGVWSATMYTESYLNTKQLKRRIKRCTLID